MPIPVQSGVQASPDARRLAEKMKKIANAKLKNESHWIFRAARLTDSGESPKMPATGCARKNPKTAIKPPKMPASTNEAIVTLLASS